MYDPNVLNDLRNSIGTLSDSPVKGGIDKTYAISDCLLTLVTYRNQNMYSKKTRKEPLFLAAALLHFDSTYETFKSFFDHLETQLNPHGDEDIPGLQILGEAIFGTDQGRYQKWRPRLKSPVS